MDHFTFEQQLIDDFDIEQLGLDMVPFVKQETRAKDFATCSMAAQPSTRPAGSVDNFLSYPHPPQPETAPPSVVTDTAAVKEEFTSLDCHKWTEKNALNSVNFLEMCAAEILCPEAGVLDRTLADKVLTECVKSVARSEGLQMTPKVPDGVHNPEVLSPVAISPQTFKPEALNPEAFSSEVPQPISESSRKRRSSVLKLEESDDDSLSENSSDTVLFEKSKRPAPSECGLDTPPDTPPDTPVPPQAVIRSCSRSRTRGACPAVPTEIEITDYDLVNLPVRELNKCLQGYPKDQVAHLKQKRRTLKNRGYAQNCRSKRILQKHELESMNKDLYDDIDKLKKQLVATSRERDFYKQRCKMLQTEVANAMKGSRGSQLCKLPSCGLLTDGVSSL